MKNNQVIKNIDNITDEYIVIGVSAGPDSMALLHLLINNTTKKIVCAHINHKIRLESDEEEIYLKDFCKKNNIIFERMAINKYTSSNFESEARNKRYAFYEKILDKYNSHTLLLAHHGDDLIETVLMKIVRGSNLEGYAGIKTFSKQKNYTIIRPLLNMTKEDLVKYNKDNKIKYYIDKSNNDIAYTRNRYRHKLLPLLKKEDRLVHQKFLKYSNTLQEYYNYLEEITLEKINNKYQNNIINVELFNKEKELVKKNIIYYMLSNIYNDKDNIIKEKHINSIIDMANNPRPNLKVNLPKEYIAEKNYQFIKFKKNNKKDQSNYKIALKKINKIDNIVIKQVEKAIEDGNNVCRLNSKSIKLPLFLRNKKDGDYVSVLGLNGKKNVSDIFIEKKIPIYKRQNYPLLVDSDDNILWIPNLKKSKYNVKKNDFCDIILTSYEESEETNENEKEKQ